MNLYICIILLVVKDAGHKRRPIKVVDEGMLERGGSDQKLEPDLRTAAPFSLSSTR